MQLETITDLSAFRALAAEWNTLLASSATHVPFLRHEYLSAWLPTLGGGEWPSGALHVLAARSAIGELCGLAPLFQTTAADGQPALLLLGSFEISDYLDLLARPEDLPALAVALCAHLAGPQAPAWQRLDLYNLPESSPTLAAIQAAAQAHGWRCTVEPLQHCPAIHLPGDWEAYLAGQVDKKQRHEIRRKMRRAEEGALPVRWYIVQDAATLETEIEDFLRLMANDPEKARFLTAPMRLALRAVMQAAFQAGWLQLAFLTVGGEKAAAYLNFDYANTIWVYNSGLEPRFRELSPGWVLLGHLLQWANEQKRTVFDFMRGDEEYKYRFGAVDRRIVRAAIAKS
jgi:CelD/BcsL family acetyltransferase involved in cellulose biosynthesis